jgi:hypothetical protein
MVTSMTRSTTTPSSKPAATAARQWDKGALCGGWRGGEGAFFSSLDSVLCVCVCGAALELDAVWTEAWCMVVVLVWVALISDCCMARVLPADK